MIVCLKVLSKRLSVNSHKYWTIYHPKYSTQLPSSGLMMQMNYDLGTRLWTRLEQRKYQNTVPPAGPIDQILYRLCGRENRLKISE